MKLHTPIQYIKGVGPRAAQIFAKKQIFTVSDLLEWYPRAYQDQRRECQINTLKPQQNVSFVATIEQVKKRPMGRSRRFMYEVVVKDKTGKVSCWFFRVPYRGYFDSLTPQLSVRVSGKVGMFRGRLQIQHPLIEIQKGSSTAPVQNCLLPLYSEIESFSSQKIKKLIDFVFRSLGTEKDLAFEELLPDWILKKYDLIPRKEALRILHNPPKEAGEDFLNCKSPAHKRIIFDEFFWLELRLAFKKSHFKKQASYKLKNKTKYLEQLDLPFELTGAQERVFSEIKKDLLSSYPMCRLVQGDVGSGKTILAFMAAALVAENGFQTALMVPTEILAEQHYHNAVKFLEPLGLKVGLLLGGMKSSEKMRIHEGLQTGKLDLCVGTHALIQEGVKFKNLALSIVDEQHRFGVHQKRVFTEKTSHTLVMTATPIPRTLALTAYGDLDFSVIDEMPKGRVPVVTRKVFSSKREKVFEFLEKQVKDGRQAYIVYPLVEESEKVDLKNAIEEFEKLKNQMPNISFGLLHGRMKSEEKEEIMRQFKEHKIDVLVSTTVIEVGVDVPNANMMIVEHAERFGLSQLHQLRGRVGRGAHKSYCVLMLGYAVSEEARYRAEVLENHSDGFSVSEMDLKLRGPGEFLGTRQSGLSGFKVAQLLRDQEILLQAREAAFELVKKDPELQGQTALKEALEKVSQWVSA